MSRKRSPSLKKNFFMNTILTMSSVLFPLISFPYITRILTPAGTGKVSFATSLISYFLMISQLGIPTYGIRACAKIRDNREILSKTVQELLLINVAMMAFSYVILALFLRYTPKLQEDKPLYIIVGMNIFLSAIGMEWLYRALEKYTYITIRSIAFKIIALIAMFLFVHRKEDYIIYAGISIFASSASNILNFINIHKYIYLKPARNLKIKKHIKPVLIFFGMSCATTIYLNLDTIMLGFIKRDIDVGYYNAAVRIKSVLVGVVTSLGTVLLPRASYYFEHHLDEEIKMIIKKAINFEILVSLPLIVYFMIFSKECVLTLSGNRYMGAITPMRTIMPTLLFIGLSNILGMQILVPSGRENLVLYSEIAGMLVDLVMNSILIPVQGATGAALGTVFAEMTVLAVQFWFLKDIVTDEFKRINYKKLLLSLILATILSVGIHYLPFGDILKLILSAMIFFTTYSISLLLQKEKLVLEVVEQSVSILKRKSNGS